MTGSYDQVCTLRINATIDGHADQDIQVNILRRFVDSFHAQDEPNTHFGAAEMLKMDDMIIINYLRDVEEFLESHEISKSNKEEVKKILLKTTSNLVREFIKEYFDTFRNNDFDFDDFKSSFIARFGGINRCENWYAE